MEGYLTVNNTLIIHQWGKGFVKEDCVIEDLKSSYTTHIYDHLLSKLKG